MSFTLKRVTWLDLTWLDLTWLDLTWLDLTWLDLTWLDLTWLDLTWLDLTWLDLTWLDLTLLILTQTYVFCLNRSHSEQDDPSYLTVTFKWFLMTWKSKLIQSKSTSTFFWPNNKIQKIKWNFSKVYTAYSKSWNMNMHNNLTFACH